jgi:hypothetical protein
MFWNGVGSTFSCEIDLVDEPDVPGTARRCYLNQKHTGVDDGIAWTCHTGLGGRADITRALG